MKHRIKKILLCVAGVIALGIGATAATATIDLKTSLFGAIERDGKQYTLYVKQCKSLFFNCTVQDRGETIGTLECSRAADMVVMFERLGNIASLTRTTATCKPFPELWKPL